MLDTQAVVQAIESLSYKSWFDYIQWIAPIILSTVAIAISLYTIRNQNQISLFEYRLEVLADLQLIYSFGESIKTIEDGKSALICNIFNSIFGTQLKVNSNDSKEECLARLMILEKHFIMIRFLFYENAEQPAIKLVGYLQKYMTAVLKEDNYITERDIFRGAYIYFDKKHYETLEKYVQIRWFPKVK